MNRLALGLIITACSAATALAGDYGSWGYGGGWNGYRHGHGGYSGAYTTYVSPPRTVYVSPPYTVAVTEDYPWADDGYGYGTRNSGGPHYGNGYRRYNGHRHRHSDDNYGAARYGGGYGNGHGRYYPRRSCVVFDRHGVEVVVRSRRGC